MFCNTDLCKQCGTCVAECPFEVVVEGKDGFPKLRPAAKKLCIGCGHCVAVCPVGALTLPELPVTAGIAPEDCPVVQRDLRVSDEQAAQFMRSRRSVRNYKDEPLPPDELAWLFRVAAQAPSAHNNQAITWSVTRTPVATRRLAGLTVEFMAREKLFPGIVRHWENGRDKILRGAPHVAVATAPTDSLNPCENASVATAYLELAAHARGLGACWAGFLMDAAKYYRPLRKAMGVADTHQVYAAVMLGRPRYRYGRIPRRKPADIVWLD
ncbi:nitroreductase family protein [Desulfocurvus sp. DL9XJH121]